MSAELEFSGFGTDQQLRIVTSFDQLRTTNSESKICGTVCFFGMIC